MPELVLTERHVFDAGHAFYAEIVTYAITQVALSTMYTSRSRQPSPRLILNKGVVTHSVLLNPEDVFSMTDPKVRGTGLPIEYCEASLSEETRSTQEPAYFVPPATWSTIAQVYLGSAYERIYNEIKKRHRSDPWSWPPELQYFRHVRNGCFHNNNFNPRASHKHPTAINPSNPPKWRTSILQDDQSVAGQPVLGKYLNSGDVPIFLADMAQILTGT